MKPFRLAFRLLFTGLLLGLLPGAARALPYDAVADYSNSSNPTGVWTYGSTAVGSLGSPSLTVYPNQYTYSSTVSWWTSGGGFDLPMVSKNESVSPLNSGPTVWAANEVLAHAGSGTASVVRFTAPATEVLQLSGSFENRSVSFSGTQVFVYHNTLPIYSGTLGSFTSISAVSTQNISLTAGDTVDFIVAPRTDTSFNSTSTGITALLTALPVVNSALPEPGALTLFFGLGIAIRSLRRPRQR